MRIGQAAELAGLEPSAIRFYERRGVVPAPERTSGGYRTYRSDHVELLKLVRRLRSLRLPLDDVAEIVELQVKGEPPCTAVRAAIAREQAAIEQRIRDLHRLREELGRLEAAAERLSDDWPRTCLCHVLEAPA